MKVKYPDNSETTSRLPGREGKRETHPSVIRKLVTALVVLVLLTPLGIWLPRLFGAGSAWGEWSSDELREMLGYVPKGISALEGIWSKALFAKYMVFGGRNPLLTTLGYLLAGLVGVSVVAAASYLLGRVLVSNEDDEEKPAKPLEENKKEGDLR